MPKINGFSIAFLFVQKQFFCNLVEIVDFLSFSMYPLADFHTKLLECDIHRLLAGII
jgi:hypothetical protein